MWVEVWEAAAETLRPLSDREWEADALQNPPCSLFLWFVSRRRINSEQFPVQGPGATVEEACSAATWSWASLSPFNWGVSLLLWLEKHLQAPRDAPETRQKNLFHIGCQQGAWGIPAAAKVSVLWRRTAEVAVSQATVLLSRKNEDHAKGREK